MTRDRRENKPQLGSMCNSPVCRESRASHILSGAVLFCGKARLSTCQYDVIETGRIARTCSGSQQISDRASTLGFHYWCEQWVRWSVYLEFPFILLLLDYILEIFPCIMESRFSVGTPKLVIISIGARGATCLFASLWKLRSLTMAPVIQFCSTGFMKARI